MWEKRRRKHVGAGLLAIVLLCNTVDVTGISVQAATGTEVAASSEDAVQTPVVTLEAVMEQGIPDVEEMPDSDELFAGYVEHLFYPSQGAALFGNWGDRKLQGLDGRIYDCLKEKVTKVADGTLSDTQFIVTWEELGLAGASWSEQELGITAVENGSVTVAAQQAVMEAIGYDDSHVPTIVSCLLEDCPYELYWFDKTEGYRYSSGVTVGARYSGGSYQVYLAGDGLPFYFHVADAYAKSGDTFAADTAKTAAAGIAVENARAIVADNEGKTDYEKLIAYKEKICELVSYDNEAADSSYTGGYGDPWQLIYVFDGDDSTNVVCEGYAKAFQYLCDLSSFDGNVTCYCVSGVMVSSGGGGDHMWNIVTLGGRNYLVDVTNSDSGSVGQNGGLFLAGTEQGSVAEGYAFSVGSSIITYCYKTDQQSLYGEAVLTLAGEDYTVSMLPLPVGQFTARPYDVTGSNNGQTASDEFWYNGAVTITPNQEAGDFQYIRISTDRGASWTAWGKSVTLSQDTEAADFLIELTTAVKNGKAIGDVISEQDAESSNLAQWKDTHLCKIDTGKPTFDAEGCGVNVDTTASWWQKLLTEITFGQYQAPSLTMRAEDALSGVAGYYYYADSTDNIEGYRVKTKAELDALVEAGAFTAAANGKVKAASGDGSYVVYVYAVDRAGNRSDYVCTDGIQQDDTRPVIETDSVKQPDNEDGTLADTWAKIAFRASESGTCFYLLQDDTDGGAENFTVPTSIRDFATATQGEWTNQVWNARKGVEQAAMKEGDNLLSLSGLQTAHDYTLYFAVVDAAGNSADGVEQVSFTTCKTVPAVLVLPKLSGIYGTSVANMTLTAGEVQADGSVLEGTWAVTDANAGAVPGVGAADTYQVTFVPAEIYGEVYAAVTVQVQPEVTPRPIAVKADDVSRIYGKPNPVFPFTITDGKLVGEDEPDKLGITLTTAASQKAAAGSYEITGTSESVNYEVTITPGKLTVLQAESAIVAEQTSYVKTYGDDSFVLGCKAVTGEGAEAVEIGEGSLTYSLSDGTDVDGNAKPCEKILEITQEGEVNLLGSGTVTVTVNRPESTNYKAAQPVNLTITVNKYNGSGNEGAQESAIRQENDEEETIAGSFLIRQVREQTYTGSAIRPEPVVYDMESETRLVKNVDYTVSYKNNRNAYTVQPDEKNFDAGKAPCVVIKGKGNYTDAAVVYFTIQPKDISDQEDTESEEPPVQAADMVAEYNHKQQLKVPVLTYGNQKLSGKDFTCSYPQLSQQDAAAKAAAYKETGTYTIHVEGTGNYTGSRDIAFTITAKGTLLSKAHVNKIADHPYQDGSPVELDGKELVVTAKVNGKNIVLQEGKHYTVSYENNTEIGTATAILTGTNRDNGDGLCFNGTREISFRITGISLAKAKVAGVVNKVYNGNAQIQKLSVSLLGRGVGTGTAGCEESPLVEGEDYEITYSNNVNVGTAVLVIQGIGRYTGTIRKTFQITACDLAENLNQLQFTIAGQTISGKKLASTAVTTKYAKSGSTPTVGIVMQLAGEKMLVEGRDFTVHYSNYKAVTDSNVRNQPTITIKGKGNYTGTVVKNFAIAARSLNDETNPVTMTVEDKALQEAAKAGGYVSRPVLTDEDGKVLKEGTDYTITGYAVVNEAGEVQEELSASSVVDKEGTIIRVTVNGKGAYGAADGGSKGSVLSATYRIAKNSLKGLKIAAITKTYTGLPVSLSGADFVQGQDASGSIVSRLTIKEGKTNKSLVCGRDFEIVEGSYQNNLSKGTASVTIRGLGEYGGNATIKFRIVSKSLRNE